MPPKKAKVNHILAPPLPSGTILTDVFKKRWQVKSPIGQGGFGAIYSCKNEDGSFGNQEFALKVEPKDNGPLFVEINFYQRVAKVEMIDSWVKMKKLSYLGVPKLYALGSHEFSKKPLRFLVLEKFGCDIQKFFEQKKIFPVSTCYRIAIHLIDALEYLHSHEFVHADIKGANILLDPARGDRVYLLDYGLASRYKPNGNHIPYKEDPRKAHDGTIEYTSIDAHKGVKSSRRADFEILGYVLLHWTTGSLPWLHVLSNPNSVSAAKIQFYSSLSNSLSAFSPKVDSTLEKYLQSVKSMAYEQEPDYKKIKTFFQEGLKRLKAINSGKLIFDIKVPEESSVKSSNPNGTEPVAKRGRKPKHKQTVNSDSEAEPENLPSKLKRTTLSSTGNESNDSMVTASSSLVAVESSPGVPPKKLAKKSAAKNKAIEKLTDVNDRQCQTSPWLYEEFRAERRKRRRQAYHE